MARRAIPQLWCPPSPPCPDALKTKHLTAMSATAGWTIGVVLAILSAVLLASAWGTAGGAGPPPCGPAAMRGPPLPRWGGTAWRSGAEPLPRPVKVTVSLLGIIGLMENAAEMKVEGRLHSLF